MSDSDEFPEYQSRAPGDVAALEKQFKDSMANRSGPKNYVADPAPGYDVQGLWQCFGTSHRSGYATHAMSLHWMLSKAIGIPTQLVPHRHVDIDIDKFPSDRYDLLFEWTKEAVGHPHVLFSSYPPEVSLHLENVGPPLVPYIAFEGTKVSTFCRDLCNGPVFREVWVVSDFVKRALVAGGVSPERVRVVYPMLTDGPWTMTAGDERAERPVTPDDPFTFGCVGTWHDRKGMHDLVRAYWGAFRRADPVKLVIRTSPLDSRLTIRKFKDQVSRELAEIAREFGDDAFPESRRQPKVELLLGTDATDQELIDWLGTLDCYANATYGEGLGIPQIWAKAQGVPMVSTAFGAVGALLMAIADRGGADDTFVEHWLEPVSQEMCKIALMFDRDTKWARYEPEAFGAAMMMNYECGRRIDYVARDYIRDQFSADVRVPPVREALRALVGSQQAGEWKI
jgi:glycosyltransferase involved in cell wall biosynthesis